MFWWISSWTRLCCFTLSGTLFRICGSQKSREQIKVAAVEKHQQQRSALTPSAPCWELFRPWQLNIYFLCSNYSQHKFPLGHNWVTCSGFCYLSAMKSCVKCINGSRTLKSWGGTVFRLRPGFVCACSQRPGVRHVVLRTWTACWQMGSLCILRLTSFHLDSNKNTGTC